MIPKSILSAKNVLVFLFCLLLNGNLNAGTGFPYYVKNFNPGEINENFSGDLYCVAQMPNGKLLFGTKSGMYVFDGTNTLFVPVAENNYVLFLLPVSNEKIYVGLNDDFGYLKAKNGKFEFVSLNSRSDKTGKVYKIFKYNSSILFCTNYQLIAYNDQDSISYSISTQNPEDISIRFHNAFLSGGRLIVRQSGLGLFFLQDKKLNFLKNTNYFKDIGIFGIRNKQNKLELLSVDRGLFTWSDGNISHKDLPYLNESKTRSVLELNDGNLCIHTANNGLFITDSLYNLLEVLNTGNGFGSDKINMVLDDFYGNIWTAGENGFNYVAYNSSIIKIDKSGNLPGKIYKIQHFNNAIFAASSQGLFFSADSLFSDVKKEPSIKSAVWDMEPFSGNLLVASNEGLYKLNGHFGKEKIQDVPILKIAKDSINTHFFALGNNSVFLYDNHFKKSATLDLPIKADSYTGWAFENNRLYVSVFSISDSIKNQVWALEYNHQQLILKKRMFIGGEIGSLFRFKNSIYFSNNENNYLIKGDTFALLTEKTFKTIKNISYIYPFNGKHIVCTGNRCEYLENGSFSGQFNQIKCQKIFSVAHADNTLYYATDKGLFIDCLNKKIETAQQPKITLSLFYESGAFNLDKDTAYVELPGNIKTFGFLYSSTYMNYSFPAVFYWRMLNSGNNWVESINENSASFYSLSPGDYIFQIKGKSIDGTYSNTKNIHLRLLPPWYRTVWAYIFYIIAVIAVIILIVRLYVWRLRKQNLLLEKKVEERTLQLVIKNKEIEQQKEEITTQKIEIEKSHVEITDSINYAQRIQQSLLPQPEHVNKIIAGHFLVYQPRNIVSGDFYWINKVNDTNIIIAADCTGHGVPGAFMSFIGISSLNEIVLSNGVTSPAQIINQLRDKVIKLLNPDESTGKGFVKDGMDISVCALKDGSREAVVASANNRVYVFRAQTCEIEDIDADRMPVGYHERMDPFSEKTIPLNENDFIVFSSDGFCDQNGGENNKKFMAKRFRQLLSETCSNTCDKESLLKKTFENWKGNNEQVDDILVLGFSIVKNP